MLNNTSNMPARFLLFLLTLLPFHSLFGQNETNVWYFGDGAGLDFNTIGNPIPLEDGEITGGEGVASICNAEGELQFYTNSVTVWRSDHLVMTNGYDLNGSTNTNQSSIIVPSPTNNGIYYLFTLDTDAAIFDYYGLSYSEIDMNQWSGFGAVTENKNIEITTEPLFEKLTAVHHANGIDVWVLVQKVENEVYEAYLVTADGINTTAVVSDVSVIDGIGYYGAMKASHNGTKIASIFRGKQAEVLDFDSYTGILSNPNYINFYDNALNWEDSLAVWAGYSVEFSPSDRYFYVSHLDYGPIAQFDLNADDISASRTPISVNNGVSNNIPYCTLQLGIDGKIYVACSQENFLSVINSPNEAAAECNFADYAVTFDSAMSTFGLPQFIQSSYVEAQFSFSDACKGDTAFFIALNTYDSLYWNFGDPESGENNYSNEDSTFHVFENAGSFTVVLGLFLDGDTVSSSQILNVPAPQLNLGIGDTVCIGDNVKISAITPGAISYLWFDDSSGPSKWVTPPDVYWVTVDEGLCVSTDSVEYWAGECAYISYPNIFTPNNDNYNDHFLPFEQWYVLEFSIIIYDRWGKEVYSSDDFTKGWDGKNLNGNEVADGVYFYMARYSGITREIKEIKGNVQLTRTKTR